MPGRVIAAEGNTQAGSPVQPHDPMRAISTLAVAALALASCTTSTPSQSATGSAATSASASVPEPSPTPTLETLALAWSDAPFEGTVAAVTADNGEFVTVSADAAARVAWTSSDGISWDQESVPIPVPALEGCFIPDVPDCIRNSAGMGELVRLGDTLYSFGTTTSVNDYLGTVGWRRTDGQQWAVIESRSRFHGFGAVQDASASDSALIAIKYDRGLASDPTMWRWTVETSWKEADFPGLDVFGVEIVDSAWGSGTFAAIGAVPEGDDPDGSKSPTLWTSDDGAAWMTGTTPPDAVQLCSISSTSRGFIVLGSTASGMASWASLDASSWTRSDLATSAGTTPDPYTRFPTCGVVELDQGLLAVDIVREGTLTWTSVDGSTWQEGPMLDVAMIEDGIAAVGNTVVLFGRSLGTTPPEGLPPSILMIGAVEP
jgi:hypothetical protein